MKQYLPASLLLLFLLALENSYAQGYIELSGPTSVTVGENHNYNAYYYEGGGGAQLPPWGDSYWSALYGDIYGSSSEASVTWTAVGYGNVSYELVTWEDTYYAYLGVTIAPAAPSSSATVSYTCTTATLTRTSDPTSEYDWYWQSASDGQSTALGNGQQAVVSNAGNYYLRTRHKTTLIWSLTGTQVATVGWSSLNAGSIGSSQTICYNATPSALTSTSDASGSITPYSYQWQYNNEGTWTNISGASATTYSPGQLTATRTYRRAVTACSSTAYSNEITVTVYPDLNAGGIAANQTICYNTDVAAFTNSTNPTGGNGSYAYQWQWRSPGGSWTNISGATSSTYDHGNLTETKEFHRLVTSCGQTKAGNTITVTVYADLNAGSIAANQTICYNANVAAFTNSASPTGGNGSYSYQWQWRSQGGSWTNISGATSITYDHGNLTTTKEFQRLVTSCGQTKASNTLTVTVHPDLSPGTVAANQSICYNTDVAAFTNTTSASGGNGSYAYQWQWRSPGGSWSNISGATSVTYDHGVLTLTKEFRRRVISCATKYSNILTVTVDVISVGGSVAGSTEAFGSASGTLTLSGHTGTVQKWQQKIGAGAWTNISNTSTTYNFNNVQQTTSYRAEVKSGSCSAAYSSEAVITLYPVPTIIINGPSSITYGGSTTLSVSSSYYSYQWVRNDTDLPGETGPTLLVEKAGFYHVRVKGSGSSPEEPSEPVEIAEAVSSQNLNYIRSLSFFKEGVTGTTDFFDLNKEDFSQTITYFDGLGRPMQTVINFASPAGNDVVQPVVYDAYGREFRKYLPFTAPEENGMYKSNVINASTGAYAGIAAGFYNDPAGRIADDGNKPFAETIFEPTPLNRVLNQGAPGAAWQPDSDPFGLDDKTIKMRYGFNSEDEVLLWTYDRATHRVSAKDAGGLVYYDANELMVSTTNDEHNNQVIQYSDKQGNIVLNKVQLNDTEFTQTYYIYDDYNDLVCVITPEGVKWLTAEYHDAFAQNQEDFLKKWAYRYKYNGRKQMIEKHVPGAKPMYMVYDKRNRLVMTQHANQREAKQWMFTKYDTLNRPVISGIYTHSTNIGQQAMSALISKTKFCEAYNGNSSTHGYTNEVFPTQNLEVLTVTYYDNYDFKSLLNDAAFDYKTGELTGQETTPTTRLLAMTTATKVKELGTSDYLWTVNYYDDRTRVIQAVAHTSDGIDRVTSVYDFTKVQTTRTTHKENEAGELPITRRFVYDHAGRVKETWHKTGSRSEVLLAKNQYNELSQVITKKLHVTGTDFKQKLEFDYTIRGWLKSLNDPVLAPNALFTMTLNYNTPTANGGEAQYNGNISEMIWQSAGADQQSFGYYYDTLNRLKEAQYFNLNRSANNGRYNEIIGGINLKGYDHNGNILELKRYGRNGENTYGLMDNLAYNYGTEGNKLQSVTDAIASNAFEEGFKEQYTGPVDYEYDDNGNMVRDRNKGIDSIRYNYLNLAERVKKDNGEYVTYTYDATGRKLKQQVYNTSGLQKTTRYLGEFVYENDTLRFILHEEGRIVPDTSSMAWEYQYFLRDHLGNNRVVFSEKNTTTEYKATLEDATQTEEQSTFAHYSRSGINVPVAYNHTPGGNYSQLLHGGFNSQVGLAKSFEVNPGDIFDIEVYAKYQDLSSTNSNYSALFNALVSAFSLSSSGGTGLEGQEAYNTFEGMFSAAPFIETNLDDDENAPKAYLNYILFDENFVLQDFGFDQIDASANQSAVHDYLSLHVKVEQKGYLYIYLSNENPTLVDVFFDDFKIVHHTGVEQVSDFYAFGLQINSLGYQRPSTTNNLYLYNGKESQSDIDASIYDYGARMYLSDIGRWGVIDPLAEVTYQISPFVYTYNNPINFIDPNGMLGVGAYGESLSNGAVSVWFNASPQFTFEGAAYTDIESLQQAMVNSVMQDVAKGLVTPPSTLFVDSETGNIISWIDGGRSSSAVVTIDKENRKEFDKMSVAVDKAYSNPNQKESVLRKFGKNYMIDEIIGFYNMYKNPRGNERAVRLLDVNNQVFPNPDPDSHGVEGTITDSRAWGGSTPGLEKAIQHNHYSPLVKEGLSTRDYKHEGEGIYNVMVSHKYIYFYNRGEYQKTPMGKMKWIKTHADFKIPRSMFNK